MLGKPEAPEAMREGIGQGDGQSDDGAPLVEQLDGSAPRPDANRWLVVWRASALLVLVALLVVGAANVIPRPVSTATFILRRGPTPTPVVPDGWARRGPSDASAIAFGQAPSPTAYACGPDSAPPGSSPVNTIHLYGSADGGSTWRALSFQIAGLPSDGLHGFFGISCMLSVNPANAKEVALLVGYQACGQGFANALYRSHDGGATWGQMMLPAWDASGEVSQASGTVAWVGPALYVAADEPCGTPLNRVAVSANGSAFTWANDDALFADAPSDATLGPFTPVAPYVYVRLDSRANCPPTCNLFKRSSDGGRTWTTFTATWQGQQLYVLNESAPSGDGSLFAQYYPQQQNPCDSPRAYYRSTDGGATWDKLPPLYEGLVIEQALTAPDGTVYVSAVSKCAGSSVLWGIYRHNSGDEGWTQIVPLPGSAGITLTWDQAGHPAGLWATPASQGQAPILVYQAP